jgi:hypothetical protein
MTLEETVMKMSALTQIFSAFILCALALAQEPTPSQTNGAAPSNQQTQAQPAQSAQSTGLRIAPGSVIPVRLNKTVDAKKAKPGDQVEAKVTQDMKAVNGNIVIAKDTEVVGHVTEAIAHNKEQKESQLGIAFDHAVMKGGGTALLPMSIQAVIAPPSQNPQNAGGSEAAPSASSPGSPSAGSSSGRSSGMGTGSQQAPTAAPSGGDMPGSSANDSNARPPITANTQGVVGISDYKLSTGGNAAQGSVVSSDKSNVKLESGTFMLLRVNQ